MMKPAYNRYAIAHGIATLPMELPDKEQSSKLTCQRSMRNPEVLSLEAEYQADKQAGLDRQADKQAGLDKQADN